MKTLWTMIAMTVLLTAAVFAQTAPNPVLIKNITTWDDNTVVEPWNNWVTRDVADGLMYFQVWEGPSYHRIYRTDGTAAGTYVFADHPFLGLWGFKMIDGIGYFEGMDQYTGVEPWRSDGTSSGTYQLADFGSGTLGVRGGMDFTPLNGKVYFPVSVPKVNGASQTVKVDHYLVETDGTQGGTVTVCAVPWRDDAVTLTPLGNSLLVETYDLWSSDGTRGGTVELMDICPAFPTQSCIQYPYSPFPAVYYDWITLSPLVVNGVYYIRLSDGVYGDELWRSDGTPAGTYRVTDINPGGGSSWPCMLTHMDGYIYFAAYDPEHGMELWRTDGIPGNEELVADINPNGHSQPYWITAVQTAQGSRLFFSADNGTDGRELWVSDGNPQGSGTFMVHDINPGSASSDPDYTKYTFDGNRCGDEKYALKIASFNGRVYFAADDGQNGVELWQSDGTLNGTQRVVNMNPGGSSYPHYLTELNGKLLFFAGTPQYGYEWYSYDPSQPVNFVTNTPPVASFTATPDNGLAPLLVAFDGSASNDPDGTITTYEWDFGDGSTATGVTASHSYPYVGTYTATLTVTDDKNATGTTSLPIIVTTKPPLASFTATPTSGDAPLTVYFDGSASSDPDAGGGIISYDWDFGDGNSGSGAMISHTYQLAGTYTATLTVTDAANATDDASTPITVNSTGGADIYVDQQSIARVTLPGNRTAAQSTMIIRNNFDVVQGAVVCASYTGPTSGTVSGTTDASGSVTLETASTKKDLNLDWCFTVTDIQLTGYTFNEQMGVPYACEGSSPKRSIQPPASCLLHAPYPNPFGAGSLAGSGATQIRFDLKEPAHISLRVYDALGRIVATLSDEMHAAGSHAARFQAGALPSGTYFLRLSSPEGVQSVRVVVQH